MNAQVFDQAVRWTVKKMKLKHKRESIVKRICKLDNERSFINLLSPGSTIPGKWYKQYDRTLAELSSLSSRIQKCQSNIDTLKICLWS